MVNTVPFHRSQLTPSLAVNSDQAQAVSSPTIRWRIVFDADAFYVQIANDLNRGKLNWMYAPSEEVVTTDIPSTYLNAINSLGDSPGLVSRCVRETRAVPRQFVSLQAAHHYATTSLGMSESLQWAPPKKVGLLRRLFGSKG